MFCLINEIWWVTVVLIGCGAVNILILGFPVCSIGTTTPTGKSLYASRVRFMALYQTGLKTFTTHRRYRGSFTSHKQRRALLTTKQLYYLMSYCTLLLKRLSPQTTRGAKKVHCIEGLWRMEDLSRWSPFRGGPGLLFYDSLIMNAAHFDFTEH